MSTKIGDLIALQYFSEFGKNKKLLTIYDMFKNGNTKYMSSYIDKTKVARVEKLKQEFANLEDENLSLSEQIKHDVRLTGYVQSTYDVDKRYAYVQEVDTKFAPRISMYCLQNGKISSIKIKKHVFKKNPISIGDVVYCKTFAQELSKKFVDNNWVPDGTMTWWLNDYEIKNPDILK
jgi:hypothetical protein